MRLETPQIAIAAQVWVCDGCGNHDPKTCGCDATAHMEAMAAKREATRQAVRRHREEKAKQNQQPRNNYTDVENIEESEPELDDSEVGELVARRRGFLYRAAESVRYARYEDFSGLKTDEEMIAAARQAIAAWTEALQRMEINYAEKAA